MEEGVTVLLCALWLGNTHNVHSHLIRDSLLSAVHTLCIPWCRLVSLAILSLAVHTSICNAEA